MEVRISCPICGQAEVDSLPEHLQNHSKQSLIDILLVQHNQIRRQLSSPNPSVQVVSRVEDTLVCHHEVHNSVRRTSNESNHHLEFSSNPSNVGGNTVVAIKTEFPTSRSSQSNKIPPSSVLRIEYANEPILHSGKGHHHHVGSKSKSAQLPIKIEAHAGLCSVTKEPKSAKGGHPTFMLVDHGASKPGPSRRRISDETGVGKIIATESVNDVPPATSIIQYIIDEVSSYTFMF